MFQWSDLRVFLAATRTQSSRVRVVWDALDVLLRPGDGDEHAELRVALEKAYAVKT